ncbi:MAG: carbohydrate-binding domain-containing protein [Clostridia bacterium]|nr:carbohydrate-binding domain-containing protein [Clostridia bacterium]
MKRTHLTKLTGIFLAIAVLIAAIPLFSAQAYATESATLTFSDSGITETVAGSGYTIDGTTLTITAAGTYRLTGSCAEGTVIVNKSLSGVTLILDDLTLTSAVTAPIVIKKSSDVLIKLEGSSTLTDNEDASTEETNADFEGAAIKVKSGSTLTFFGDGTLTAVGNAKNALKGGTESNLIVDGGTFIVTAQNSGIAFDGSVVINAGTFEIASAGDGIKAVPDEGDTASAGTVTINGGTFNLNVQGDGIQAGSDLLITNGDFTIKTENGYTSTTFDKDTMSCKGIKSSGNNVAEGEEAQNTLTISGGTFDLNTADDAIHSDAYAVITGGTFTIHTGDDGVHADTTLTLGSEDGYERDPQIIIYACYEGLEAGTVNTYSGKYWIVASDDGINAAGGSSNGTDPGQGGHDPFNPGGRPGPGGQSGGESSGDYSLNFYGGDFYVSCLGDGLDSNGALNLLGGTFTVLSQGTGGDNSPLDADGTMLIRGATVFAAGTNSMNETPSSSSQKYYTSTTRYNAGTVLNVTYGGSVVDSEKLVRNINYLLYSSPSMTSSSCTVSTASSVTACKSNAFAHDWDDGVVETPATTESAGVMLYTCRDCGDVERRTIPKLLTVTEYTEGESEESGEASEDEGYAVTFAAEHASINVYYTQDYTAPDETGVTVTTSRNSATGDPDSTGSGQVNFTVVPDDGYTVSDISIEGTYKNLKGPDDTGLDNTYRITKIESDLTVTVTVTAATDDISDTSDASDASDVSREYLPGDANDDGSVDMKDVLLIRKFIAGMVDSLNESAADYNADGSVDMKDVLLIRKFIAGLLA